MNDKERVETASNLFRSLNDDDEFNADPKAGYKGVRRTYVVLSVADRSVHAEPMIGSDPKEAFTLGTFLSRNARVSDIWHTDVPEPEKGEAEELFDACEGGDRVFSEDTAGRVKEYAIYVNTFRYDPKTKTSVTLKSFAGNCAICTEEVRREEFIARGFTATRPKTEQEVELEATVVALGVKAACTNVELEACRKTLDESQSRVNELEGRVSKLRKGMNAVLNDDCGRK